MRHKRDTGNKEIVSFCWKKIAEKALIMGKQKEMCKIEFHPVEEMNMLVS